MRDINVNNATLEGICTQLTVILPFEVSQEKTYFLEYSLNILDPVARKLVKFN